MATSEAPVEIGRVALNVKDLSGMADFYRRTLGLHELSNDGSVVVLGSDRPLLELHADKARRIVSPHEAGLFHTAFLLPTRADLGAWIGHLVDTQVPLSGASDHAVSEALYLRDPEGNGIEVYVDRPRDQWEMTDTGVNMGTRALDLRDVHASARGPWADIPDGSVVGHVHLQVGDLAQAEDFVTKTLGMDVMQRSHGARFFSSGGYHHHLAGNIWNSAGAGARPDGVTGLADVELLLDPSVAAPETSLSDPWGTRFSLKRKAA